MTVLHLEKVGFVSICVRDPCDDSKYSRRVSLQYIDHTPALVVGGAFPSVNTVSFGLRVVVLGSALVGKKNLT